MTFGRMPIANGFLTAEEIADEYFFELAPAFCDQCNMFQLVEQPQPEKMFHGEYAFFSSTSRYMQRHFEGFATSVMTDVLAGRADPFVVELGSNDGIMLRHFHERGIRHLGVEPSENVADVARSRGIQTVSAFFDRKLAERIVAEHGGADALLAANVMCHIPDLPGVAAGARHLLKPDGVFIFEDPYLGDMIAKTSYDQIYDEHVFIFSATSIARAFAPHGLELVDVAPQITHGGSMRYTLAPNGSRPVSAAVDRLLAREREQGLDRPETYLTFRRNCEASRASLMQTLEDLRSRGKRVVGYGATSKSTTVTNYCGITPGHVEFISDTTPIKQGKLSPGAHIPVRPYSEFVRAYPDYALLFAWNHAAEIREKEQGFMAAGGRWIVYVPTVQVTA
jgi:methylation protein EvaC